MVKVELCLFNLAENLSSITSLEGKIPTDQSVKKNTKGPNISFLRVGALEDFWSHIVGRTSHS